MMKFLCLPDVLRRKSGLFKFQLQLLLLKQKQAAGVKKIYTVAAFLELTVCSHISIIAKSDDAMKEELGVWL
jgi:hypothetical protein